MTGLGYPGAGFIRWLKAKVRGAECLYCGRRMPIAELLPLGVSSWRCRDWENCRNSRQGCK